MCLDYDPNPENDDFSETLAAAQEKAAERPTVKPELEPEQARCGLCRRPQAVRQGYWTAAGFICGGCAHEMSDEAQR